MIYKARRIISALLVLVMVCSLLPSAAFAAEASADGTVTEPQYSGNDPPAETAQDSTESTTVTDPTMTGPDAEQAAVTEPSTEPTEPSTEETEPPTTEATEPPTEAATEPPTEASESAA